MTASNDSYRWMIDEFAGVVDGLGYGITLVHGVTPETALTSIGGRAEYQYVGVEAQWEAAVAAADVGSGTFVGAAAVGSWALLYESVPVDGDSVEPVLTALSAGSRLVSHRCDDMYQPRFHWVENGEIRVTFDPSRPADRHGTDPDSLLVPMRQFGFQLDTDDGDVDVENQICAAFALSEHLTGVRLTPQLLASALFHCGTIPTLGSAMFAEPDVV